MKPHWWQSPIIRAEVKRLLTNLIETDGLAEELGIGENEEDRASNRQAIAIIIWGDLRSCVIVNGGVHEG